MIFAYEHRVPAYPNDPRIDIELEAHVRAYLSMLATPGTRDPHRYADRVTITRTSKDGHRYICGELRLPDDTDREED